MLFNMSVNRCLRLRVQRYYNFRRYANFVDKKQYFAFGMDSVSLRSSYTNSIIILQLSSDYPPIMVRYC